MAAAARLGDFHQCPQFAGSTPHIGGPVATASADIQIDGLAAGRAGDAVICACGGPDTLAMGCPTVLFNNKLAARVGDLTMHGGVQQSGSSSVDIGGLGDGQFVMLVNLAAIPEKLIKKRSGTLKSSQLDKYDVIAQSDSSSGLSSLPPEKSPQDRGITPLSAVTASDGKIIPVYIDPSMPPGLDGQYINENGNVYIRVNPSQISVIDCEVAHELGHYEFELQNGPPPLDCAGASDYANRSEIYATEQGRICAAKSPDKRTFPAYGLFGPTDHQVFGRGQEFKQRHIQSGKINYGIECNQSEEPRYRAGGTSQMP